MSDNRELIQKTRHIAEAIRAHGGRALLVGGFVRDRLLGEESKDADVEVYGLESLALHELLKKWGRVNCVGESFQVYKLSWRSRGNRFELDISLPRFDRKVSRGHRGFDVQGDPFATTEDAARRRDFTINAMMWDPLTDELIDHFGGQSDLKNRLLRVVDPQHFGEDSLRVLRAMQFGARFGLTIEPVSAAICRAVDLSDLPAERLWGEWEKLLMKAANPSVGLRIGQQLDIFSRLFPDLERAMERHGEALCETVDRAAALKVLLPEYPRQVTLMLTAICIFLSGPQRAEFLKALGIFTLERYDVRRKVLALSGERKRARDWFSCREDITDKEFRFLAARLEPRLVYLLTRARGEAEAASWFWENVTRLGVQEKAPAPLLQGRHLLEMGLKPGPRIGKIVNAVYLKQLEHGWTTFDQAQHAAQMMVEEE